MANKITTDWASIQTRSVDPFANVDSDIANKVHLCLGKSKMYFTGFDIDSYEINSTSNMLMVIIKPGSALMDYVSIKFTENIILGIVNFPNLISSIRYIVLEYEYIKESPAPIAILKVIDESEFNIDKQLILYTFKTNLWNSIIGIDTWMEWINQKGNFTDNRFDSGIVYRTGDTLTGNLSLTVEPTEKNHLVTKDYVDNKVSAVIDPEKVLKTTGGIINGPILWDNDRVATNSKELITKKYVDEKFVNRHDNLEFTGEILFTNNVKINRKPIESNDAVNVEYVQDVIGSIGELDAYLRKSGGTMSGVILIPTSVLNNSSSTQKLVNYEFVNLRYLRLDGGTVTGPIQSDESFVVNDKCLINKEFADSNYLKKTDINIFDGGTSEIFSDVE